MKDSMPELKQFAVLLLKTVLYVTLFSLFFLLFSIDYPQITALSRTAGITMMTFAVSGALLLRVYGGYSIGKQKSKPIIYSLTLAVIITDVITYIQFCIMNASEGYGRQFRFANPWTLLAIILFQVAIIIVWTYLGNYLYFEMYPPERVCVITSSQSSLNKLMPKIQKYKKQYKVCEVADYQDEKIYDIIMQHDTVFIYDVPMKTRVHLVEFCYDHTKNIYYNPEISDIVANSAKYVTLDDKSMVALEVSELSIEQRFLKRFIDILLSLTAIIITSPIMLVTAAAIKISDRGKILFTQKRATKGRRIFYVYKFRTMKENVKNESARKDDKRVTKIGKFLRRSRLDELPQLFNVLKGDMSLVGPRPEMLENVYRYTNELPEFEYRLRVKAGLTGNAQIFGKYNTSPKDKLVLDLMYIESYSVWLDIKLLFQTFIVFFKSDSTEGFGKQEQIEFVKYTRAKDQPKKTNEKF